jgi:hypothetical protein
MYVRRSLVGSYLNVAVRDARGFLNRTADPPLPPFAPNPGIYQQMQSKLKTQITYYRLAGAASMHLLAQQESAFRALCEPGSPRATAVPHGRSVAGTDPKRTTGRRIRNASPPVEFSAETFPDEAAAMYRNFMTALNKADRSALRDMVPAATKR